MRVKFAGSPWAPSLRRLAALLRVVFLVVVTTAIVCALLLREASAQLDGALLSIGSRAMAFPGAPSSDSRVIRINGVQLGLRTEVVHASLTQVLRHYRDTCARSGEDAGDYGVLIAALATRSGGSDRDGYVACVETGVGDLETLVHRILVFSRTWDLADLGRLRYVYASRSAERPNDQTFLLTMWADGPLGLLDLLPIGGSDASGADLAGVPRPPGAQRILSASEVAAPSGLTVYLTEATSMHELTQLYRRELTERDWRILERNPNESTTVNGVHLLAAEKAGRTLSVLTYPRDSHETVLTLLVSEPDQ